MISDLILAAYFASLAVIFYGLNAGWFRQPIVRSVARVVGPSVVELEGGATITCSRHHYLQAGDQVTFTA